ncbi:putative Casein kinase I protein isoform 1 [Cocos nucifera]|nr:putative Casein kinase I protein isoform 1 [Cocos nucifera]
MPPSEGMRDMDVSSSQRRNQEKKHQWNAEQDAILIGCLIDLKNDPMWKGEGGNFKPRSKKRKVSKDEEVALIGNLIETVGNLGTICQASSKGIDKLADCFQFLADDQELKKKVYEAITEIEDLELQLMVKAGSLIAHDSARLTSFHYLRG